MNLYLEKLTPQEWAVLSENALKYSFDVERPASMERISYALVVRNDKDLCCYSTIVEMDAEHAYMQHGGNFPTVKGTIFTTKGYLMMINYLREHYKFITTSIWNKNKAMLKLAWAGGFVISGVHTAQDGSLLVMHEMNMEKEKGGN
jgi:hypothetical protein